MNNNPARFALEYWRWLRREIPDEPNPAVFGTDPVLGEAIAKQCHIEFERKTILKGVNSAKAAAAARPEPD